MTSHNICAGFYVIGIYPINPRAIPPEKFVTSSKCQELEKVQLYSIFNPLIHCFIHSYEIVASSLIFMHTYMHKYIHVINSCSFN